MPQTPLETLMARVKDLQSQGVRHPEAFKRAQLEREIQSWPKEWGDCLEVMLYGGVDITEDISVPELGLRVKSERKTGKFVFSAPHAYRCQLEVKSKDVPGVLEAIERLENFLNAWHVVSGGRTIHYFCNFFVDLSDATTSLSENLWEIKRFLTMLDGYSEKQRRLILRAAWWLRQSQHSFLTGHHDPSSFEMYSSHWNAFECLTKTICDIKPPQGFSRAQKEKAGVTLAYTGASHQG